MGHGGKTKEKPAKQVKLDKRFAAVFTDPALSKGFERDGRTGGVTEERADLFDSNVVLDEETAQLVKAQRGSDDEQFKWDAQSTSESEMDSEDEAILEIEEQKRKMAVWNREEEIALGESSSRISIMGCDWTNVDANDLLVLCHSNIAGAKLVSGEGKDCASSAIKCVAVYLSDFGASEIAKEDARGGPSVEELEAIEKKAKEMRDDGELTEATALAIRKYDIMRARYYYAIVECASVDVADELYAALDGVDVEFAVDGLDIRYVPDDITKFPREPTSVARVIPYNYKPPIAFESNFRLSNPALHWDEPDQKRHKRLTKKFTEEELNALDLEEYIASASDEDEVDASMKSLKARLRALPEAKEKIGEQKKAIEVAPAIPDDSSSDSDGLGDLLQPELLKRPTPTPKAATLVDEAGKQTVSKKRKDRIAKQKERKREREQSDVLEDVVRSDNRFADLFEKPEHFVDALEKKRRRRAA